jgi:hypothetical protein
MSLITSGVGTLSATFGEVGLVRVGLKALYLCTPRPCFISLDLTHRLNLKTEHEPRVRLRGLKVREAADRAACDFPH